MPPSTTSEKITLTYPLYAADFLDADRLAVGGGGGEGRSGVGNKITLLDVSKSSSTQSQTATNIKQLTQCDLSPSEDSCMSLAIVRAASQKKKSKSKGAPKLLAGVNSSEQQQREGKNEHFRVFSIAADGDSISAISKHQLFTPSSGTDSYQRVLRARGSLAAIANGGAKSGFEIVVMSTTDFTVKRRIATDAEVADLDLADDGTLVYCTAKEIFTAVPSSNAAPTKLNFQVSPPIEGSFRSLRFLTRDRIVAIMNAPGRTGAEVLLLDSTTGAIIARQKLHHGIKAVSGLDVVDLTSSGAIAVSGADQSVEILVVEEGSRIKRAQVFKDVHPFQISKVVFSPPPPPPPPVSSHSPVAEDEKEEDGAPHVIRLATTSIGNTVAVHTLPLIVSKDGYTLLRSGAVAKQTVISVLLSLIAVVVFAVLLQVVFVARGGLTGLHGISELLGPLPGIKSELTDAAKAVEADVDALIEGLKSGAATDPFGEETVPNYDSIREELLKEAAGNKKDEL